MEIDLRPVRDEAEKAFWTVLRARASRSPEGACIAEAAILGDLADRLLAMDDEDVRLACQSLLRVLTETVE